MARTEADLLARRIESQAMISAVPGQLRDLEQIAREVRALGEDARPVAEPIIERVKYDIQASDDGQHWRRVSRNPYLRQEVALRAADEWRARHSGLRQFRVIEVRETWTVVADGYTAAVR